MKKEHLYQIGATALATSTLILVACWPCQTDAGGPENPPPQTKNVRPVFETQGCQITLKTDKETYATGEEPIFELRVRNTSDHAVTISGTLTMEIIPEIRSLSRVAPAPRLVGSSNTQIALTQTQAPNSDTLKIMPSAEATNMWSAPCELTVQAGQTGSLKIPTKSALSKGQINVILTTKSDSRRMASFSVLESPTPIVLKQAAPEKGVASPVQDNKD